MGMDIQAVKLKENQALTFIGPPLEQGVMPALFYFALSARDSLTKDPFNQPVQFLEGLPLRIFSMTLPGHEEGLPPENGIRVWAEQMDLIPEFIDKAKNAVKELITKSIIPSDNLAVAGLSRGAFIAAHLAAVCPEFKTLLGFAPLTHLSETEEFKTLGLEESAKKLNLSHLIDKLYDRRIRFYVGNQDHRTGTKNAFAFIDQVSSYALEQRIRTSPIELRIGPSIGYLGHGTSPETFREGANWIKEALGL